MKKIMLLSLSLSLTIVMQSAVIKSISGITPGGLKAALTTEELTTITELTLTGSIDGRDFQTMRDEMTVLEIINLSATTVNAYSGAEGNFSSNSIPSYAFYNYTSQKGKTSLKTFLFPKNILSIDQSAFNNCTGLAGTLTLPSNLVYISSFAFYNCSSLTGSIQIPSNVETIGPLSFYNCNSITGVINIPGYVRKIESDAFLRCGGTFSVSSYNPYYSDMAGVLFNLIIENIKYKTQTILIKCPILKSGNYTIPSTITTISQNAFAYCKDLNMITIPPSVTTIRERAFYECSGLSSIYALAATPPNIFNVGQVFDGINKTTCILYVPLNSKPLYEKSDQWQDFKNIVEIKSSALPNIEIAPLTIYPNPTIDGFKISSFVGLADVLVTDANGKLVVATKIEADEDVLLNNLQKGAYIARITTANGVKVQKIIKR